MTGVNHPKGFSLFEVVIVLSVFSIALVLVVTIFENASQSQRQQALSQAALSDARLALTSLTQAVKNQHIDYRYYKGKSLYEGAKAGCDTLPEPGIGETDPCNLKDGVHVLALVDTNGQESRYWFDETTGKLSLCVNDPLVAPRDCSHDASPSNYVDVTPASLNFTQLMFYITPLSDPAFRGTQTTCGANAGCTCVRPDPSPSGEWSAAHIYPEGVGCAEDTSGYCDASGDGLCVIPDAQPTVTVAAEIEGEGLQVGKVRLPFQITVTSRLYDR